VPDQLDGNGIDARLARVLAERERWQFPVIRAWQVPADIENVRRDQVKVIQEPFGGRRDEPALVNVAGQRAVRGAEGARVVLEARQDAAGMPAPCGVYGESRGQGEGALIEPLDTEKLVSKWFQCQRVISGPRRAARSATYRAYAATVARRPASQC